MSGEIDKTDLLDRIHKLEEAVTAAYDAGAEIEADDMLCDLESLYAEFPGGRAAVVALAMTALRAEAAA